jgi:hypothetical protein
VIATYIALFINTWYSEQFLGYSLSEQARDVAPSVGFSLLTGVVVLLMLKSVEAPVIYLLLLGSGIGIVFYLGLHLMAGTKEIMFLKMFIIPKTLKFIAPKA